MALLNNKMLAKYCLRKKNIPYPKELIFELTSRCNFRCKMCFYNNEYFKGQRDEMSLPEIAICISKLPKTIKRAVLIGGEPLLKKDIVDIVRLFSERRIAVSIVTNGYLLTPALSDQLNVLGNVEKIVISLDGPPEIHNKIRGVKNAFERSYEHLKYAANYFNTEVVSVIQPDNETALRDLFPYLKEIPNVVFAVEIMRKYTQQTIEHTAEILCLRPEDIHIKATDTDSDNGCSPSKLLLNLSDIRRDATRAGLKFHTIPRDAFERIQLLLGIKNVPPGYLQICTRFLKARLDSAGNIIHCFALGQSHGSLLRKNFGEIWNGKDFKNFRKHLVEKNLAPICSICFAANKVKDIKKFDNQVGIGIVGCGLISHKHAKTIQEVKSCFLTGVSSRHAARGDEFAIKHRTVSLSLLDLVEKSDALIIATEPSSHAEFIHKIISHCPRHLLIEKPLTTELEEYQELLKLRNLNNNKIFGISSQERFSWLFQGIQEILKSGKIGIPKWFNVEYSYCRNEDYYKKGSGWRLEKGGNVIFNQGVHVFDFLYDLFGMPNKVFCCGTQVKHRLVPFDTVRTLFSYPDNFIGTLGITVAAEPKEPLLSCHIRGTKGEINLNSTSIYMQILRSKLSMPWGLAVPLSLSLCLFKKYGLQFLPDKILRIMTKSILPFSTTHLRKWRPSLNPHDLKPQIEEFIDAINGVKAYCITLEDAHRVVMIAEAVYESLKNNKEIILKDIKSASKNTLN